MKSKYVDDFDYTKVIDIVGLDDDEITDVKDTLSLLVDWKDLGNTNLRKIREFLTPIDYRVIAFIIFEATGVFAKKIQDKTHPWNELYRVIVFNINLHYPFIDPVIACKKIGVSAHDKEQSLLCSAAVMLVFVRSAFDDEDYDYDKLREVSIRELIQRTVRILNELWDDIREHEDHPMNDFVYDVESSIYEVYQDGMTPQQLCKTVVDSFGYLSESPGYVELIITHIVEVLMWHMSEYDRFKNSITISEEIKVLEREFLFNPDRHLLILSLILLNAEYERLNDLK